jgi:hypothetical protein
VELGPVVGWGVRSRSDYSAKRMFKSVTAGYGARFSQQNG